MRRLAAIVLVGLLAGCGGPEPDLQAQPWRLVEIVGPGSFRYGGGADGPLLELRGDGTYDSPAGCNSLAGRYAVDGSTLRFPDDVHRAWVGCPDPVEDEASTVLGALFSGTATFEIEGDRLVISDAGVVATYVAG